MALANENRSSIVAKLARLFSFPIAWTGVLLSLWMLLVLIALARRGTGRDTFSDATTTQLALAGLLGGLLIGAVILARENLRQIAARYQLLIASLVTTACLPALLAGVPRIPMACGALLMLTLVAGACTLLLSRSLDDWASLAETWLHQNLGGVAVSASTELAIGVADDSCEEPAAAKFDETSRHWSHRFIDNGSERLEGQLGVEFSAGQKLVTLHVPFSPPFISKPDVYAETDADGLRVTVPTIYPHGCRIEVRRSSATQAVRIAVRYAAAEGNI